MQAADAGIPNDPTSSPHLSDFDPSNDDPDPISASISVLALKTVRAGEEMRINEDGALTPDDDTLDAWLAANDALEIVVVLQEGGRHGIFKPSTGVVQERLWVGSSHGVADGRIVVSWDPDEWSLSLAAASSGSATRADFQKMLDALQLRTVHFEQVSHRTILVRPELSGDVFKQEFHVRDVRVGMSLPNPVLEVAFDRSRVDAKQRLVLAEEHILVYDPDTTDASQVFFRVSGLTGGTLQRRSSDIRAVWQDIGLSGTAPNQYREFTLAELRAGRIAFLAGDGLASGNGEKIVFQIQAADAAGDAANLSGSDPLSADIVIVPAAKVTAGFPGLLNADRVLTPGSTMLTAWKQTAITHSTPLYVIVKLFEGETTDALSLRSGYNASKITALWNEKKGELSIRFDNTTTVPEMKTALGLVELSIEVSLSDSARKVWVFPTLSEFPDLPYRFDASAGLARYYLHDNTNRSFSDASTEASQSSLFGKQGYLGVFTSDTGRDIYNAFVSSSVSLRLAISDSVTEGKWLVTDGPRKGQLFWDHTTSKYGSGAAGSGWSGQTDFWHTGQPDDSRDEDYAIMRGNRISDFDDDSNTQSVIHYDLLLEEGEIFARLVNVKGSSSNPILRVDFSKSQATAQRPLILTGDHISVTNAATVWLRITEVGNGKLQERTSALDSWVDMTKAIVGGLSQDYYAFTLAQLQSGLVAFLPTSATSPLTFDIQAADDKANLSDSDPYDDEDDADPTSISISVVALKTVAAGEEVRINGDGALTPDNNTLDAWLVADDSLQIFVVLGGGKEGIITLAAGLVQERLSVGTHSVSDSKIAVSWDAENWRLSLEGTTSARRADFQAVLNALQLQTVHSGQVSHRTISVSPKLSPELSGDVSKKEFHVREVQVSASAPNPILEVAFDGLRVDSERRLLLTEEHISVYDPDTTDASSVWLRVTGLTGGDLQRRSASDWTKIVAGGKAYLEFTLEQLRAGRIAILAGDGVASADSGEGTKVAFQIQAADAPDNNANLSDSDPNDGESDADPVDAEILVVITAKATAGFRGLINADGVLSPDETTLGVWKQEATTHSGTLHVIVRLGDMQDGDILSLRTGYDTTKIKTADWDATKKELSIEFDNAATPSEMKTVLGFLEFEGVLSDSASTRKVWVFPTLSGVGSLRYRLDASAGLVRYYFYDSTSLTFSAASTAASGRSFFGKSGYLGVYTSDTEKSIYTGFRQDDIFLALTDSATEGKWLVTAGPRKGQLFWDNTNNQFGPGAAGSGWDAKGDFWGSGEPNNGGSGEDYVELDSNGRVSDVRGNRRSVSHHDLWLSEGEIVARSVDVGKSPPNPVLSVDFSEVRATAQRPLILTEHQIFPNDPDTRDSTDSTKVDASKIKFRITNIANGMLRSRPSDASDVWTKIPLSGTAGNQYREFTLAQLQSGLVAFFPDAATSPLTFDIQAADDGLPNNPGSPPHLSDSDLYAR